MAVALVANSSTTSSGSSISLAFNNSDAGNIIVIVCQGDFNGSQPSNPTMKYNNVALTQNAGKVSWRGFGVWVGHLKSPATGSNTALVTFSNSADASSMTVFSISGADQTTPVGTAGGNNNNDNPASSISISLNPARDGSFVILGCYHRTAGATITDLSGQTRRHTNTTTFSRANSSELQATSASEAFGYTFNASNETAVVALAIQPPEAVLDNAMFMGSNF